MPSLALLLVTLYKIPSAYASTGPSEPSFVPTPSGRGTIDLITSCVFTLSLCAWTAIHLNVPRQGMSFWRRFVRKLGWALTAAVIPEFVLCLALNQFAEARRASKLRNIASSNVDPIATTAVNHPHAHCSKSRQDLNSANPEQWTLEHGYFALMGGFVLHSKYTEEMSGKTVTLDGVLRFAELGILPNVSRSFIRERSKSNLLAKGLVCFQVSWMLIQTLARKIAGLPVTLLELNTLAHVGCAVAMYAAWWFKPQDVVEPVIIDVADCPACNKLLDQSSLDIFLGYKSANLDNLFADSELTKVFLVVLNLCYGGIHAAAWNAHFPSVVEQNFWRAAACSVFLQSFWLAVVWGFDLESDVTILTSSLFIVARLFLITEAFISVRSLPIGADNTVSWSNFLPHIG
jgi:hypothetical protein